MQVLILGAGAVGGYIGSKLLTAGADVVFLVRGPRLEKLRDVGLTVTTATVATTHRVRAVDGPVPGLVPDVVVIACKAPALESALDAVAPSIAAQTRILPLLNGVAHLEALQQRFPDAPLLSGLVHGALNLRDDGTVELMTPFFSAVLGALSASSDPIAGELLGLLTKADVDARLSSDIRRDMWEKFVFLTTLAGITCLMRASIGTIIASDDGEDLIRGLLAECIAIANAEGFPPAAASMEAYKRPLLERGSAFTSSMLRDVRAGRRTEADHILKDMLRRAQRNGLDTPILRIAAAHMQCYEIAAASQ